MRQGVRSVGVVAAGIAFFTVGVASAQIVVHADNALRGVPPSLVGANFTSYGKTGSSVADWAPCSLDAAALLPQPVAVWRIPGGILGSFFHINGLYDNANLDGTPNGVDMQHWISVAGGLNGQLLVIMNINASDQELENEVEYLNAPAPATPDPAWTPSKYRFDAKAPAGYFAWLRGKQGHAAPVGVRWFEFGNEVWNSGNDTDTRCNHDATCYGKAAAAIMPKLKAIDPDLQLGVSILTIGQSANPGYKQDDIYAGFATAGSHPDFVFDHGYYGCGKGSEDVAEVKTYLTWADNLATAAKTNRTALSQAFPDCGDKIGMFVDEFGPQACASDSADEPWEQYGPWETAAAAHVYAAALHDGYTHASYYSWNGSPTDPNGGRSALASGQKTVDANFWGLWFASAFLKGAASEVAVDGTPGDLRVFAVSTGPLLRVLVVNTNATASVSGPLQVAGGTAGNVVAYTMDTSFGTPSKVPAQRSGVPQTAPVPAAANLDKLSFGPYSTTLFEIDMGSAVAPSAPAAATGCMTTVSTGGGTSGATSTSTGGGTSTTGSGSTVSGGGDTATGGANTVTGGGNTTTGGGNTVTGGGNTTTGGGSAVTGSGNTVTSAGASGGTSSTSATATSAGDSGGSSGCGCRVADHKRSGWLETVVAAVGIALVCRRRRKG
jgi:MYXO-CTERM domain-containing protein